MEAMELYCHQDFMHFSIVNSVFIDLLRSKFFLFFFCYFLFFFFFFFCKRIVQNTSLPAEHQTPLLYNTGDQLLSFKQHYALWSPFPTYWTSQALEGSLQAPKLHDTKIISTSLRALKTNILLGSSKGGNQVNSSL